MSRLYVATIAAYLLYGNCFSMDHFIEEFKKDINQAREDLGTIVSVVAPTIGEAISGELPNAIEKNPYKDTDAYVRQESGISEGEKQYLKNRLPIVKTAIEKLLKQELQDHQVPKIAFVNSGGGYRAMTCTIGSLAGAEEMGLLNATTYVTGLSGSTWAIAPWISTQMPLKNFKEYIKNCAAQPFTDLTDEEELLIYAAAGIKAHFKQPRTLVDLYGDLLGNRLLEHFGDGRHTVYLSDQANIIQDGSYPYPIYTAIDADERLTEGQPWYEFTPHEIGNEKGYIQTWAFGRKFKEGKSHTGKFSIYPPEKNLSYHLGTYGSAFGANIKTIKKELAESLGYETFLADFLTCLDGERPFDFYAKVPNYAYKLESHHTKDSKIKSFVDAGTDFNLAIPPLAIRNVDIMIICDASAGIIGHHLKKAADYMAIHQLPFPKIDYENIDKKTISVFKEEDPTVPIVIYLPRISDHELWEKHKSNPKFAHYNLSGFNLDHEANDGFATTIHFQYAPENAQKVIDQMEFNIRVNEAKIIKAIEFAVKRKKIQ